MELKDFIIKFKNDVISDDLLSTIYSVCDMTDEDNVKDFNVLFPIVKEIYYIKSKYKETILNNYENKETLKDNLNKEDYFIYDLLDKGIDINDIINYKINSMKRIIIKLLNDSIIEKENIVNIKTDLKEKIQSIIKEDISIDEMNIEVYKLSNKLSQKFEAICKLLNL